MKRLLVLALALLALASVSTALARPWAATTAQDEPSLYVNINELRFGWTPDLPAGGTCSFTGQLFGLLSSVPMHIVVENEEHRTIAVQEVGGTILHNDGEDWYRCDATFDMPLPEAEFYTVRINDVYHSTIPAERVGVSPVLILLESGESWRPVG
jgi:hypothetical protein